MGRGRQWTLQERHRAALAFADATDDPIVGRDQTKEAFEAKMFETFIKDPPANAQKGTFADRTASSVYTYFKNNVSPDVQKFNSTLRLVRNLKLSGVTEEDIIRIAVAVHLMRAKGANNLSNMSSRAFYVLKTSDPMKWPNYLAWTVLRRLPKFREATRQAQVQQQEEVPDNAVDDEPVVPDEGLGPTPQPFASLTVATTTLNNEQDEDVSDLDMGAVSVATAGGSNRSVTSTTTPPLGSSSSAGTNNNSRITQAIAKPSAKKCGRTKAKHEVEARLRFKETKRLMENITTTMKKSQTLNERSVKMYELKTWYKLCKEQGDEEGMKMAKEQICEEMKAKYNPTVFQQSLTATTQNTEGREYDSDSD